MTPDFRIRPASSNDCPEIVSLIRELAVYEKLEDQCRATPELLAARLFGPRPAAEVLMAESDGDVAGFALFFMNFSTFACAPGIYLEDLFVRPAFRKRGIGTALLARLAAIALERGCARFEWAVLDWNQLAIRVYERLGARSLGDWTVMRLEGDALRQLAAGGKT